MSEHVLWIVSDWILQQGLAIVAARDLTKLLDFIYDHGALIGRPGCIVIGQSAWTADWMMGVNSVYMAASVVLHFPLVLNDFMP